MAENLTINIRRERDYEINRKEVGSICNIYKIFWNKMIFSLVFCTK